MFDLINKQQTGQFNKQAIAGLLTTVKAGLFHLLTL